MNRFFTYRTYLCWAALLAGAAAVAQTAAPVVVTQAWVRTTVPGQMGTGGYMRITAAKALRLVGVSSPVAGVAEVHEMRQQGDVMQMRAVPSLELPAGQTVELKPGGLHLILMDLKRAVAKDSRVPITLRFQDAQGVQTTLDIALLAGITAPAGKP